MTNNDPSAAAPRARLVILDDDEQVGILVETVGRLAGMATLLTDRPVTSSST